MSNAERNLKWLREIVDEQTEDDNIWFLQSTDDEFYLQQALRRLHEAIESVTEEIKND